MKRLVPSLVGALLLISTGAAAFVYSKPRLRPAPVLHIARTPERVARGRLLAEQMCLHCHTPRDEHRWTFFGKDAVGSGGQCWSEAFGFPGRVCSRNLTSDRATGVGAWSDGELVRAIREGVSRNGRPLVPLMPYQQFRLMSDADSQAIVAYLRTLPAQAHAVDEPRLAFPLDIMIRFAPRPLEEPVPEPNFADEREHGEYLATLRGCKSCHTPHDEHHNPLPGREFAGGAVFQTPWFVTESANLTPHATGLGTRTRAQFIALFRASSNPALADAVVAPENNAIMPWLSFASLTDTELGAIYAYLSSVPAIANTPAPRRPAQRVAE